VRWQLVGDWPLAGHIVPSGTALEGVAGADGSLAKPPTWNNQALPTPLPINARALDQESALQMCLWYEETDSIGGWHQLHFADGIDREAIFAQARNRKRWPPDGVPPQTMAESPSAKRLQQDEKPAQQSSRRR